MKSANAWVGARIVDSLPFSSSGYAEDARRLKAAGADGLAGYLGAMTKQRLEYLLDAGLAYLPVTFAGEYMDGAGDELFHLGALGIPVGTTVFLDLEGKKAFDTEPTLLASQIDTWATAIEAARYIPGLYVGSPQPLRRLSSGSSRYGVTGVARAPLETDLESLRSPLAVGGVLPRCFRRLRTVASGLITTWSAKIIRAAYRRGWWLDPVYGPVIFGLRWWGRGVQEAMGRNLPQEAGCRDSLRGISGLSKAGWVGGVDYYAHRLAWAWANGGEDPGDRVVRHACDNPACINPEHLLIGTHQDNSDDKVSRGRQAAGERHGSSKLYSEDVRQVKCLLALGISQGWISKTFGVSRQQISKIAAGQRWGSGQAPGGFD